MRECRCVVEMYMVGEHGHTGAWGVDVDEHTLRKSKRKNLLVSEPDAWM